MRRLLLMFVLWTAAVYATVLTGTLNSPAGGTVTGTLTLTGPPMVQLTAACGGQGGQVFAVPTVTVAVSMGVIAGTDVQPNTCFLPVQSQYSVLFVDAVTARRYTGQWNIAGTMQDVTTLWAALVGLSSGGAASVGAAGLAQASDGAGAFQASAVRLATSAQLAGVDVVTNGNFAGGLTGWTPMGGGWSIVGGHLHHAAGAIASIATNIILVPGDAYLLKWQVVSTSSTTNRFDIGAGCTIDCSGLSNVGQNVYEVNGYTGGATTLGIVLFDGGDITISSIQLLHQAPFISSGLPSTNDALGAGALGSLTSGSANLALGAGALYSNTEGAVNVAIGFGTLMGNTTGSGNTAVGVDAIYQNTSGNNNVSLGAFSGQTVTTGSNNVFLGFEAGSAITTESGNVFLGNDACADATGSNRLCIDNTRTATPLIDGDFSARTLTFNATTTAGTIIMPTAAAQAGTQLVTNGDFADGLTGWTVSGDGTGWSVVGGHLVKAPGNANHISTTINAVHGSYYRIEWTVVSKSGTATYMDLSAGCNSDCSQYSATGANTYLAVLGADPTGPTAIEIDNVDATTAIEISSIAVYGPILSPLRTAREESSVVLGIDALTSTDPLYSVALGVNVLHSSTGVFNVAAGYDALWQNTTGGYGVAIGTWALNSNTTGSWNIGIGQSSLGVNTTGDYNVGIGSNTLQNNVVGSTNVAIGKYAGLSALGSGNVFLGANAGQNETGSNQLYIDNTNTASPLIKGDFLARTLFFNALKIGVTLRTPASSTEACAAGEFADDASFHYVCTGTNVWKRAALSSF